MRSAPLIPERSVRCPMVSRMRGQRVTRLSSSSAEIVLRGLYAGPARMLLLRFNRFALNPTYQFAFPKIPTSWDGTFEGSVLFYEGSSNGQAPIVLSCL